MTRMTNRNVPLDRLALSSANVRTTRAHADDDKELQESILSLGVLESLLVLADDGGSFHVVAGGRRLAALRKLAENGSIPATCAVPCRVLNPRANAAEISLHENVKRAAMHPADQYEAYARLRNEGMTAAEIASRSGVSERQVTKLMRLASVAPELLAAFRNDELHLQTLMAFTVTDDHKAQLAVWEKARRTGMAVPEHIKQQLMNGAVSGTSALARFIGVESYEKAGGRVQRDLFSHLDTDAVYLLDRALAVQLAEAKLKKTADRLARDWKWVEIEIDPDWDRIHTLHRLRPAPGTATAAEQKRLDELADQMQDIADNPPMDPAEQGVAYARSQELNARHEKLEARIAGREKYRPEDRRIAGCIVYLRNGNKDVVRGLVLPEDVPAKPKKKRSSAKPTPAAAEAGASPPAGADERPAPAAPEPAFEERFDTPWTTRTTHNPVSPETAHAKEAGLSTAVMEDLAAIRTGIVRAALAKRFDLAFDLVAYLLVMDSSVRIHAERPLDIRLGRTSLRPIGRANEAEFAAANPGEQLHDPPAAKWMTLSDDVKRFDAFRGLPDGDKQDLFARAVATSLYNQAANQHRVIGTGERLVELLEVDFAKAVRPSEKYFWKRLTRDRLLETAEAVVGKEWAKARRNHKKAALAADMAAVFGEDPQGRAALDPEARERIEQWTMPGFKPWDGPKTKR